MSNDVWVQPAVLEGTHVRLEPLSLAHAPGLVEIADIDLFRYFAAFHPTRGDARSGEIFVQNVLEQANKVAFAIIDKSTGRPAGSTSFMDIRAPNRGLEIGSTWLAHAYHGSVINPEAKLLLLTHAFEELGAVRLQFRTDSRNLQSQRAIEKLGAVRDGVFRHDTIMPDGYLRDSIFYSILSAEWPAAKAKLLRRLATFESTTT